MGRSGRMRLVAAGRRRGRRAPAVGLRGLQQLQHPGADRRHRGQAGRGGRLRLRLVAELRPHGFSGVAGAPAPARSSSASWCRRGAPAAGLADVGDASPRARPTRPSCSACRRRRPGGAWRGVHLRDHQLRHRQPGPDAHGGLLFRLQRGPDGSPFTRAVRRPTSRWAGRAVSPAAPASRPVSCGPDAARAVRDDPAGQRGLEHLRGRRRHHERPGPRSRASWPGPSATAAQGGLANMPFTVRYAGPPTSQVTFRLSALLGLPGALFAVTPATIVPLPGVVNTTAQVGDRRARRTRARAATTSRSPRS